MEEKLERAEFGIYKDEEVNILCISLCMVILLGQIQP